MKYSFQGHSVLVTGAASGIGEATARLLAANGLSVVVSDLHPYAVQRVIEAITATGGKAVANIADVADPGQLKAAVDCAVDAFGGLHFAVNNAGIGGPAAPTGSYTLEGWQKVIDINLSGVFYGMRYAIPEIEKAGGGSVVNVASILGSVGFANSSAYVAAKHGVLGATKNAALEHAAAGVRVNAVAPAWTWSNVIGMVSGGDRARMSPVAAAAPRLLVAA